MIKNNCRKKSLGSPVCTLKWKGKKSCQDV
jgi:hypothetical protein